MCSRGHFAAAVVKVDGGHGILWIPVASGLLAKFSRRRGEKIPFSQLPKHLRERGRKIQLTKCARFYARKMINLIQYLSFELFRIHLQFPQDNRHDGIFLYQDGVQKMRDIHLRIAARKCDLLRVA